MIPVLRIDSGAELGAWVAAVAGTYALGKQLWDGFKKRRQERDEIEEALDRTPEVRQQLELGNVGEAIKHLNEIIEAQAKDAQRLDRRLKELDQENEALRERAEKAEESWQSCNAERMNEVHERVKLETELDSVKRNFARTLANLRQKQQMPTDEKPDLD